MSYTINNTDGVALTTLIDGTTNTTYGLTLIGRNYTSYGEIQNENFVRILENFASSSPPGISPNSGFVAVPGQLWWDTANQRLRVFNGADFISVSEQNISASAPTTVNLGDQWYDDSNKQLKVWATTYGTGVPDWQLIGPGYTASQGKSGAIVETVTDTLAQNHTVVNTYTNGNLVSVSSYDNTFTPNVALFPAYYPFVSNIQPGINLPSYKILNGTANNSVMVGGIYANSFARSDINTTFTKDISVNGNIVLTNANIYFSSSALILQNKNLSGNITFYVNTPSGKITALNIDGSSGLAYVSASPTGNLGISTKGYVDTLVTALTNTFNTTTTQINSNVAQVWDSANVGISNTIVSTNANLSLAISGVNTTIIGLSQSVDARFVTTTANAATQQTSINTINNTLPLLATIDSPTFTGSPAVPTVSANNNSTTIASTAYVDSSALTLSTDYNQQITNEITSRNVAIASAVSVLAPIASPTFTGAPTAPTPTAGDNSGMIATTAFVTGAIASQKFNYTVSAAAPTGGNDGDFWFQIG